MRVPLEWLREYCDPDLDVHGIEERLTMTGTKVEAIHHHGVGELERFVVGRVLACERHPDADRLSVCKVDLGPAHPGAPATIVCGAPNVAAGQTVAVATPGAVMPDGMKIKRTKLRGVASEGMILAERELAIDSSPLAQGILVLDDLLGAGQIALDAPLASGKGFAAAAPRGADGELAPGTPLTSVLPIATEVLELEVTPNRPDCLGVYGVARELHAATGAALASEPWSDDPGSEGRLPSGAGGLESMPLAEVEVHCPDLCPRFTARVFENVTIAQSPPWLKARLSAAGQRPINNVVDITNYVMLLTAQPLHAFDLDRVAGSRLVVRRARDGEQVQTLDGQTRMLDREMVVIEDADGPTSIAGLMGGVRSEVGEGTTRVLMEVANWNGPNIHRSSWTLGLRSEASARFEKGLAPEQCLHAQALATRLMIELCGATVVPGTIDVGAWEGLAGFPSNAIRLREARVQAILGVPIPRARQQEILRALDFKTAEAPDGLDVTVPPLRRADVTREADLIEEVARIDGLERLPATLPRHRPAGLLSHEQRLRRRAVDALVGRGLYETLGWSFSSPQRLDELRLPADDPRRRAVAIENPLSEDQSLLRTTLLGSLLDSAVHNAARDMVDLGLFEVGTVFTETDSGKPDEQRALGVFLSGRLTRPTWRTPDPPRADLFAVKAVLEMLAAALRVPVECQPGSEPFLHPGRAAAIYAQDTRIGWLGELHPLVVGAHLEGAAAMELNLDCLIAGAIPDRRYSDLTSFPALHQDLAVVLPEQVLAARVIADVRAAAGELLDDVDVFDVYSGPQIGAGRRSLALALSFRAADRTLTDGDIAPLRLQIMAALRDLGGELRA
jgi:phenylalanyl-tRNA synthetase beta chain